MVGLLRHVRSACDLRSVPNARYLSSILPKLPFDRQQWPSTLASNKKSIDLDSLQASLKEAGVKYCMPCFVDMVRLARSSKRNE